MDWNWFFSSLAQSAAAIVGIFGAFIITKILSNQAAYSEKKNRLAELIVIGQKITDDADALAFDWYNNRVAEGELDDLEEMLEANTDENAENLYDRLRFSIYERREMSIQRIEQYMLARGERKRKEQEALDNRRGIGSFLTPMLSPKLLRGNLHIRPALEKERDAMDHVAREARHHTRLISGFVDAIKDNPESSPMITAALVLVVTLFYVGVIYPLSFMPTPLNWIPALSLEAFVDNAMSLKGILLIVVSIIFTGMLALFFMMNLRMKYTSSDVVRLTQFVTIGTYSLHFAIMDDNLTKGVSKDES